MRIAVVEDDFHMGHLMCLWLEEAGHRHRLYADGRSFQRDAQRESFDLVVLDWMLPDINGDELLVWLRDMAGWSTPVLFVTARDSEEDIVRGLSLGADDYMAKPVRRNEFLARVAAVARRGQLQPEGRELLRAGPYEIDPATRTIRYVGEPVDLTQKEFDLALFLFRNAGRVLSRSRILENVWGVGPGLNTRTVDTHVSRLRSKLGIDGSGGWRLVAVYNHGYRLESSQEPGAAA